MADDTVELIAPGGCDEANHGLERYRVDNNGRVHVPREAAFWLIRAGFKVVPPRSWTHAADEQQSGLMGTIPEELIAETTAPTEDGDGADPAPDPRLVPRRSSK